MVVFAKLVAKERDTLGYITYVFECVDVMVNDSKYVMCTRYPNWDHKAIEIGDTGYLNFIEIRAGIDKWYDGHNMIPYNYNGIQFVKFVQKPRVQDHRYIM